MEIIIKKHTDLEEAHACIRSTMAPEFVSKASLKKIYGWEHSINRSQLFTIQMIDIPAFVSTHMVRHNVGITHFVRSCRSDRLQEDIDSGSSRTYHGYTSDFLNRIFDYRDGKLFWKIKPYKSRISIGDEAGSLEVLNRYVVQYSGKRMKRSIVIFMMHHGYRPPVVDHIDRDTLNDHIDNLRASTPSFNAINTAPKKGFKGVFKTMYGYIARIQVDGVKDNLGTFKTLEEAALAYDAAALRYFNDHAYLNFPDKIDTIPNRFTLVNHRMVLNADSILAIARKRLCYQASPETREIVLQIREKMKEVDPDLAYYMVPNCIYRGMICPEPKPCGHYKVRRFRGVEDELEAMIK